MSRRRPKTCGKAGARNKRAVALSSERREVYEKKLERDRARLRRIYHERREAFFARGGNRCAVCGIDLDATNREIDHEDTFMRAHRACQPHRSGWEDEARENYQPLCIPCHDKKTRDDRRARIARSIEIAQAEDAPF